MQQGLKMTQLKEYNWIWRGESLFQKQILGMLVFKGVAATSRKQRGSCWKMKSTARSDLRTCPGSANLSHPWEQNNPQLSRAQVSSSSHCCETPLR